MTKTANALPDNDKATIFISIASYCDPLLKATIEDACAKAIYPERLKFGVVEQTDLTQKLPVASMPQSKQIRYLAVDRLHSRGAGWARNVAMSLYQQEDWFFQIDSHMIFKFGWDVTLLESAAECAEINPNFVISSYPNPFNFVDGVATPQPVTEKILAHVVRRDCDFDGSLNLGFIGSAVDQDKPIIGFHLGAGCLLAPGKFVSEFPYDPQIYFLGEEQALAARLFTRGWDIFHVPGLPIFHLYESNESPSRPKHWSQEENAERVHKWDELATLSRQRVDAVLLGHDDYGIYGLGQERTMEEYASFSGIDYKNKTVSELARTGHWTNSSVTDAPHQPKKRTINIVESNPFHPTSWVFSDAAYYLYSALQESGLPVRWITKPIDDDRNINIFLGSSPTKLVDELISKHNIHFNFEQLRGKADLVNSGYINWLKNKIVFDCHGSNIEYLKEINGDEQVAFEIPISTSERLDYLPEVPNTGESDVLFFGAMDDRRKDLIEALKKSGLVVQEVSGSFGRELAPAIKKTKLIIHAHYGAIAVFPYLRVMQAIACKVPVLCEDSVLSAKADWEKSGMTFASYDKLVETAHRLLAMSEKARLAKANKLMGYAKTIKPAKAIKAALQELGYIDK